MTGVDQLLDGRGRERYAPFVGLGFARHAYVHPVTFTIVEGKRSMTPATLRASAVHEGFSAVWPGQSGGPRGAGRNTAGLEVPARQTHLRKR